MEKAGNRLGHVRWANPGMGHQQHVFLTASNPKWTVTRVILLINAETVSRVRIDIIRLFSLTIMTNSGATPNIGNLELSDADPDDLFASPSRAEKKVPSRKAKASAGETLSVPTKGTPSESRHVTEEAREAALRRELEGVRNINEVIEGVIGSLDRAKENMEVRRVSELLMSCHTKMSYIL